MGRRPAAVLLLVVFSPALLFSAQRFPGQKPLVVLTGNFFYVPGSWARYSVLDKTTNESYTLTVAVLDRRRADRRVYARLEVAFVPKVGPSVITRVLAEQTDQGPGPIQSGVMQVEGLAPLSVPQNILGPGDDRLVPIERAAITRINGETAVCCQGKLVRAWRVEVRMPDGSPATAIVSRELAPTSISELESASLRLSADDWGRGVESAIREPPLPFGLWLLSQMPARLKGGLQTP